MCWQRIDSGLRDESLNADLLRVAAFFLFAVVYCWVERLRWQRTAGGLWGDSLSAALLRVVAFSLSVQCAAVFVDCAGSAQALG